MALGECALGTSTLLLHPIPHCLWGSLPYCPPTPTPLPYFLPLEFSRRDSHTTVPFPLYSVIPTQGPPSH